MKTGNPKLAATVLISGVSMVISYLINLLITPYITEKLGIEAYGFVSIAKTAVSYASIATVALTSFIVRFISVSYHAGDMEKARGYYASSVAASVGLLGILMTLMILAVSQLEYILNIPENLVGSVKLLFVIVFLNFGLTTISTPLGAVFYIKNRLDILGVVKIVAYIAEAVVLLCIFSMMPPSIWFVGVGSLTATLVILLYSGRMTRKLTPELRFRKESVSGGKIKTIMGNGIWNSLNSLGNTLNSGLDLLISNLFLTAEATGQIAVVKIIHTMFASLYQVILQPLQPRLIQVYAQDDTSRFVVELKKSMKICGCVAALAFAGFFALGKLYYHLWLPEENALLLYQLTIVVIAISITEGIMQPVYFVNTLTLKNKIPCWVTIGSGIGNVVVTYFLLRYTDLGAFAVVGTTTVVMLCINLFFNPMYAAKCLGIRPGALYGTLCKHFVATGAIVGALWWMNRLLNPQTWIGFFASVLPMSVVGVVIYIVLVSNKTERQELWKKGMQLLCRTKVFEVDNGVDKDME